MGNGARGHLKIRNGGTVPPDRNRPGGSIETDGSTLFVNRNRSFFDCVADSV
jgi:hypothetical protein